MPVNFSRFRLLNGSKPKRLFNDGPHQIEVVTPEDSETYFLDPGEELSLDLSLTIVEVRSVHESEYSDIQLFCEC